MSIGKRGTTSLAAALLFVGGATTAAAADADRDEGRMEPLASVEQVAVVLTPEQADDLRAAWDAGEAETPEQALAAAGVDSAAVAQAVEEGATPLADNGSGTSLGDCSRMTLWGDAEGRWTWSNEYFRRSAGPAEFGRATVTTNGIVADADSFGIAGLQQYEVGRLWTTGVFATATTVDAWSFNINLSGTPLFCFGAVSAYWD